MKIGFAKKLNENDNYNKSYPEVSIADDLIDGKSVLKWYGDSNSSREYNRKIITKMTEELDSDLQIIGKRLTLSIDQELDVFDASKVELRNI